MLDIQIINGTIFLSGRFDASQAKEAQRTLAAVNESVIADFSNLDYISSAGIGVLLATFKRLQDAGLTLRMINMNRRVRQIFEYAGLDRVLTIE